MSFKRFLFTCLKLLQSFSPKNLVRWPRRQESDLCVGVVKRHQAGDKKSATVLFCSTETTTSVRGATQKNPKIAAQHRRIRFLFLQYTYVRLFSSTRND